MSLLGNLAYDLSVLVGLALLSLGVIKAGTFLEVWS